MEFNEKRLDFVRRTRVNLDTTEVWRKEHPKATFHMDRRPQCPIDPNAPSTTMPQAEGSPRVREPICALIWHSYASQSQSTLLRRNLYVASASAQFLCVAGWIRHR